MDRIHRALQPRDPELPRDIILKLHYPEVRDPLLRAAPNLSNLRDLSPSVHLYDSLAPSIHSMALREQIKCKWFFSFSLIFLG
ncbi:hypothetical protein GDO81_001245 [Engystomops pustulosus]|uniref:Uncharacterized protein n=1 Tax=Engystomops pustulosus TaxID=76066 RepID=A0AAV7DAW5_ENGPU|nr:hypothetical protein GDO81_001245 [Engystomops pustulosus]